VNKDWTANDIIGLYSEGYTDIEVIKELGITRRQFDKMLQVNPHFRETVERGRDYSEAWNLTQSRIHLKDKDFNVSLFNSRMMNIHGWSQKVDQNNKSLNVNAEMTKEELLKKLETYLPELLPKRDAPLQIEENPE
jgi:hypothetical protein